MLKKWQIKSKEILHDLKLFKITKQHSYNHKKDMEFSFVVLDSNDWVNAIPLTHDNQVVLIRQYRAGTHSITYEIPGGVIEPGEHPLHAGLRETTEETGYVSTHSESLGHVHPNPAIQNNKCHIILATGCEKTQETCFDSVEDIETELVPVQSIPQMIQNQHITHSLVICAFQKLFMKHPHLLP